MFTHESSLSQEEIESLLVSFRTKFGVDFSQYDQATVVAGLRRAMQSAGVTTIFALWAAILKDASLGKRSIERLLEKETCFFRNPSVWKALREELMPKMQQRADLNVWSAGCATGEEAYSIAMLLSDTGTLEHSKIWATDLRETAVERAKLGCYSKNDWARFLNAYFDYNSKGKPLQHFQQKSDGNWIQPNLREKISFERHDITVGTPEDKMFDLIFCRGVLPYFNTELQTRVIHTFLKRLKPGGFFVFGERVELPPLIQPLLRAVSSAKGIYTPIR